MDLREQRGMELAATRIIVRKKGVWLVPSQFGKDKYEVNLTPDMPHCTCPDHETRGVKCKHIYAATFVMKRQENADGTTTVTEHVTFTATKQTTYPQKWSAYNDAQTHEQDRFQALLADLCSGLPKPQAKNGRPRLALSDAVFSIVFKVYSTVSQRRFVSDLREAHARGYISKVPHFNSISNYLENPALTPLLRELITESSLPLKAIETDFAADSSGFATCRFTRWFDIKYGEMKEKQEWVKCHIMCGVKTNVVTAIEIAGPFASDTKFLAPLVESTARNFKISEVSADKGYGSGKNAEAIASVGATPFIAFKSNSSGGWGGETWSKMFHYFQFRRTEFLQHYHKRSNVESTFSMIKRKFGDSLRSKTDTAMVNETLCKILSHNLVVLIHETQELGIEANFAT